MEEKTPFEQNVVKHVTQQVINMLCNNVVYGAGVEGFEGWCEDGAIFQTGSKPLDDACVAFMRKVAPAVDELTYKFLNLGY